MEFLNEISGNFIRSIATVLFLPLWTILIIFMNAAVPLIDSKKLTLNLTLLMSIVSMFFGALGMLYCTNNPTGWESNFVWLNGDFQVSFGVFVDALSSFMLLFSAIIGFIVQLYSYGFMKDDKSFHRFYIYLNLLNFALFGLILSSNAVQSYIFIEVLAAISYLLIGFWYKKRSAVMAAKKTFLFNRFGDICLLMGIVSLVYFSVIFSNAQNLVLLSYSSLQFTAETLFSMVSEPVFCIMAILILLGAMIKAAQFPFQNWLSNSMEAPIPVSALMNSIAMSAVGVYILARFYPVFILSKTVMTAICIMGIVSAIACAYIAMSQNDIKKVLAYSTSSQMGLVFTGCGLGVFSGSLFFFASQSVAKILLILVAGALIKALKNENDIKYLGGLRAEMPFLAIMYFVGCIAASGIFLGGYCGQNMIFSNIYETGFGFLAVSFIIAIFLNAFSLFRTYFLVFEGEKHGNYKPEKTHFTMILAILLSAIFVIILPFILPHFNNFIYFILPENYTPLVAPVIILLFSAISSAVVAFRLYVSPYKAFVVIKEKALNKNNFIYKLSYNGFYLQDIGLWLREKILMRFCRFLDFVEKYIIDGFVVLSAVGTRITSYLFSKSQSGNVQSYIFYAIFSLSLAIMIVALIYVFGSFVGG